jgi:cytochrome oxidase Cu insertion factor (SCO1/SenC/PrrC family)
MPGMHNRSLDLTNPFVVSLFHHSVYVKSVLWLGIAAFLFLVALIVTKRIFRFNLSSDGAEESRARTYLRWSFGGLWLIDGILQFQASMPLGLGENVVKPLASGTPFWLHALMLHGVTTWNNHPIALAAGVAWLEVGIGLGLLVSNGRTGRWIGGFSALWAAMIWLIGNGAGGVFIRGTSILFGWPGASLFYVIAGIWIFVKPATFREKFSRFTLWFLSALLVIAALLQCLPSAGFWHGGPFNALTAMTTSMAAIPQPHGLAWILRHAGSISSRIGGGFNVIVILWLLICAVGLWRSVTTRWQWPVRTLVIGCVVFWLVAQDAAVFGGLATDFNSMIPLAALAWCASPRLESLPRRERLLVPEVTSSAGAVVATFAVAMIATATITMALAASASPENTLFIAQNGPASSANTAAPSFTLTDQFGQAYALGEHPGRVTLLTFIDPVCYTDCPLLANQLAQLRTELSTNANLDIVAVAANPYHESLGDVRRFISRHGLGRVKNFFFVTGPRAATSKVWSAYGIGVASKPTDKMSIHSDLMFIVAAKNRLKWIIPDDPLATTSLTVSAVSELKSLLAIEGVS